MLVFTLGLALHFFLAFRSWIGGDQIHLLRLGLDFALRNQLEPFGKLMTGVGANPGVVLQLLVGIPLKVMAWYHSPMIVIVLFHICACGFLLSVWNEIGGGRASHLFLVLYWLSPWRLYNAGFLWEPAYIFLPAAVHFWACWKLRSEALTLPSFLLSLGLILAAQIHNSAFFLFVLTAILLFRKEVKIGWKGFSLGVIVGSLTLIPTLISLFQGSLPAARQSAGYIGFGFVNVYPMLKGALYWFTLGGLDIVRQLNEAVPFQSALSSPANSSTTVILVFRFLQFMSVVSVLPAIVASWWFFFRRKREPTVETAGEAWLRRYAGYSALTLVVSAALSPIVLQGWQVVVALHAALIPMVIWVNKKWFPDDTKRKKTISVLAYASISVSFALTLAFTQAIFRGDSPIPSELRAVENQELLDILPSERR